MIHVAFLRQQVICWEILLSGKMCFALLTNDTDFLIAKSSLAIWAAIKISARLTEWAATESKLLYTGLVFWLLMIKSLHLLVSLWALKAVVPLDLMSTIVLHPLQRHSVSLHWENCSLANHIFFYILFQFSFKKSLLLDVNIKCVAFLINFAFFIFHFLLKCEFFFKKMKKTETLRRFLRNFKKS